MHNFTQKFPAFESFHFTPIKRGEKRPILAGWQEKPFKWGELVAPSGQITYPGAGAIGLLLGEVSGGIIGLDCDGIDSAAFLESLGLPQTLTISSGAAGRFLKLFRIPEELWGEIPQKKVVKRGADHFELRWRSHQSLVYGEHPSGREYRVLETVNSFDQIPYLPPSLLAFLKEEEGDRPQGEMPSPAVAPTSAVDPQTALYRCLAIAHRELVDYGAAEGTRNDDAAALARDLIGTARWLTTKGIYPDPRALFDQFCSRCSPPLGSDNAKEPDLVWRSAEKDNPTPCLSEDKLENCLQSYFRECKLGVAAPRTGVQRSSPRSPRSIAHQSRPQIQLWGGEICAAIEEICHHLAAAPDPEIFVQGGQGGYYLVRVVKPRKEGHHRYIAVAGDTLAIEPLTVETLQFELNRRFSFLKMRLTATGEADSKKVDCPRALAAQFLARGNWPLPRLTGVSAIPVLRKDGEIVATQGYDPQTGIYIECDFSPKIPSAPKKEDAQRALALLLDWISEFPHQKEVHRSAHLSAVLTAIARKTVPTAPLHAFSAVKPGEGKGTAVRGIQILLEGEVGGTTAWPSDSEEFRKKLTSVLKSGQSVLALDNVTGVLGGDVLEQILTEPWFQDRLLGTNLAPKFSTQVAVFATGNNLQYRSDMARRVIQVVLDSGCEHPEKRRFKRDFESFTREHRAELVGACLVILKAFIQSGEARLSPLGSFKEWSDLVRSALVWLGLPDPVETQEEIKGADDSRVTLGALLRLLGDYPMAMTAREIVVEAEHRNSELKDLLLEISLGKDGSLSPRRLGNYLRVNHRSVVGGLRLVQTGADRKGFALWRVEKISDRRESDSAESAEKPQTPTQCGVGGAESGKTQNRQTQNQQESPPEEKGGAESVPSLENSESAEQKPLPERVSAKGAESADSDSPRSEKFFGKLIPARGRHLHPDSWVWVSVNGEIKPAFFSGWADRAAAVFIDGNLPIKHVPWDSVFLSED